MGTGMRASPPMEVELLHQPGNAAARVRLAPRDECTAEGGAMISISSNTKVTTTTHKKGRGGVLKGVKRLIAGESFFLNHFTGGDGGSDILFGPTLPGDMLVHVLQEDEMLTVQAGSYVASEEPVDIDLGWQGLKTFFAGESLFWIRLRGPGKVILSSFGAIYPVRVDADYIVDTGHIVAFEDTLEFRLSKAGRSWIQSFLGGEGVVARFKGTGTVWCQSHSAHRFGTTVGPMLRAR